MVRLQADVQINLSVSGVLKTRTSFALHQLLGACRSVARMIIVERDNHGKPLGTFWDEIFQDSLAVAILSVASLESYANELWFENTIKKDSISDAALLEIADLIDKGSILKKFSLALAIRSGKKLNFGIEPVQSADILVKLRNAVVHFRPEWLDEQDKHGKLSQILQPKFHPSPFFPNEPVFPRAWASADFAVWALRSTVDFLEYFYAEAGIECPVKIFKARIREASGGAI